MKRFTLLLPVLFSLCAYAQHDHHLQDTATHSHLAHIKALRAETFYIHNLPAPKLMTGIGNSEMKIETKSEKTQQYFNQGLSLLHCFWDFEAYRAFKEAIRNDSGAIMPYWGLMQTLGPMEDSVYKSDKEIAIKQLKELLAKATEHEKLYAQGAIVIDSLPEKGYEESTKKLELIVHKFPDDIDAKLFLALRKMGGFDADMNPNDGQVYSEYILRDLLKTNPKNHAVNHYWIHLMENCCPAQALQAADMLASLAPASGHIVHMPVISITGWGNIKKPMMLL